MKEKLIMACTETDTMQFGKACNGWMYVFMATNKVIIKETMPFLFSMMIVDCLFFFYREPSSNNPDLVVVVVALTKIMKHFKQQAGEVSLQFVFQINKIIISESKNI